MPKVRASHNIYYSILKRLNSPLTKKDLSQNLISFFWTLFDQYTFETKILVISKIYNDPELSSASLFNNETIKKDSITCINQITYESLNNEVCNKLAKIFCFDLEMVVDKLLTNCLNNSSQILTIFQVLIIIFLL